MAAGGYVSVNRDLQTRVVQNEDVYAQARRGPGRGPRLAAASDEAHGPTRSAVNLLADDFVYQRFTATSGTLIPYAYHLPKGYDAAKRYPVVVVLPGHGMGFNGSNEGVQVAADIPATAWLQETWTGTDEDVIVLAPQNQRVGTPAAQADVMIELLNAFAREFPVDQDRIYASTVSYGSTLAWAALATRPGLFDGVLITGGFAASAAQATAIAASGTPVWITHGTHDHLLNVVTTGQTSYNRIWDAHIALGKTPAQANAMVKYTEYADSAFSEPDRHLAAAPTYEDETILQWLLAQRGVGG
jgi:predicted peptidase